MCVVVAATSEGVMSFQTSQLQALSDGERLEGSFEVNPLYTVLLALHQTRSSGRLTAIDEHGEHHMFFMMGRPVGVTLGEPVHPIGQLLLELGRINGTVFVQAQRAIAEGNRLPGQVYKELGVIDESHLKELLKMQAKRKAEYFCRLGARPFAFARGLAFLQGFASTPMESAAVLFLAVRRHFDGALRAAWLRAAAQDEFYLDAPFPVASAAVGFGPPEERFLQRLQTSYIDINELTETGALPTDDIALMLRFLEVFGVLRRRPRGPVAPRTLSTAQTPVTPLLAPLLSSTPLPQAHPSMTTTSTVAPVSGLTPALREPTADEVFSRAPAPAPTRSTAPPPPASTGWSSLLGAGAPMAAQTPTASANAQGDPWKAALEAPTPPEAPRPELELDAPVVRKKKVKRVEPLPSEGTGVLVGETRREKTEMKPMPSIVFDDDT
jgi:hypothetical protein